MINIKNFKIYNPEIKPDDLMMNRVIYLRSDSGEDWYKCQALFSSNTVKIMYDEMNVVRSISNDVSTFFPHNMSVAEISSINPMADISGGWVFDMEKLELIPRVYTSEEIVEKNQRVRSYLLSEANKEIQPLQDALDLGIATIEEKIKLNSWKLYRIDISRVDLNSANVEWPVVAL